MDAAASFSHYLPFVYGKDTREQFLRDCVAHQRCPQDVRGTSEDSAQQDVRGTSEDSAHERKRSSRTQRFRGKREHEAHARMSGAQRRMALHSSRSGRKQIAGLQRPV
jgi:hypothetical protein